MSRDRSSSATHNNLDEPKEVLSENRKLQNTTHIYTLFIKLIDSTKNQWKQPKAWILEPNYLDSNPSFVTHWHIILDKILNLCACFLICDMEITKTCKVLATVDMLKRRNICRRSRINSLLVLKLDSGYMSIEIIYSYICFHIPVLF